MRLANAEHGARHWRIDDIAPEFRLEDVWALPTPGGPDDFPALLEVIDSLGSSGDTPRATAVLMGLRRAIGRLLGWDNDGGRRTPATTLSARLPADLRDTATGRAHGIFVPLYRAADEAATEVSNKTVHAVMQLTWIDAGAGHYSGRMAIYVKPNGRLGAGYMAAIAPVRHHIVYPAMMRQIGRAWAARAGPPPAR